MAIEIGVVIEFNNKGTWNRYASTWSEYVDMYVEEIRERYGEDTEVRVIKRG